MDKRVGAREGSETMPINLSVFGEESATEGGFLRMRHNGCVHRPKIDR